MSKKMAFILLTYGIALVGLSLLIRQIAPTVARVPFLVGMAGGGASVLCAIIAFAGHKRRTWAVLTMIAVAVALLTQVVQAWFEASAGLQGRLVVTFMFLLTVGMTMYLFHGERSIEFYDGGGARQANSTSHGEPQSPDAGRRR
jgi:hypothetical protein